MFVKRWVTSVALGAGLLLTQVRSHSWAERITAYNINQTLFPAVGRMRGFAPRSNQDVNNINTYLLPPDTSQRSKIDGTDLACSDYQRFPNNSQLYPALTVSDAVHMLRIEYNENGHVTNPDAQPRGKPDHAGAVKVFLKTGGLRIVDDALQSVLQWNEDGTGGDGNGFLLGTWTFDDGRCYQLSDFSEALRRMRADPIGGEGLYEPEMGGDRWCENWVTIPDRWRLQSLTLIWTWLWSTAEADEVYTSCIDVVQT